MTRNKAVIPREAKISRISQSADKTEEILETLDFKQDYSFSYFKYKSLSKLNPSLVNC